MRIQKPTLLASIPGGIEGIRPDVRAMPASRVPSVSLSRLAWIVLATLVAGGVVHDLALFRVEPITDQLTVTFAGQTIRAIDADTTGQVHVVPRRSGAP